MKEDIIILAGGFGSRMESISNNLPKALLPIGNRVFLDLMMDSLSKYDINKVLMSLHHKSDKFLSYIENHNFSFDIIPVIEKTPMGTGGAIKYVIEKENVSDPFFVINGDTLSNIDLNLMRKEFFKSNYDAIIAISKVKNALRYGTVKLNGDKIIEFIEKGNASKGWINNGHYILKRNIFFNSKGNFSIESNIFPKLTKKNQIGAYKVNNDNFIDMGIPEDYIKLCNDNQD